MLSGDPLIGVHSQHFLQQVQSLIGNLGVDLLLELEGTSSVLGEDFIVSLLAEDTLTKEEDVEDNADAEDVTDCGVLLAHVLNIDDLWGHVAWSAAAHKQVVVVVRALGKPEIGDD